VERVIAPDATILLDFMMYRFTAMMSQLVVYPENMASNLAITRGVIFSQMVLLKLVEKGFSREDAYAYVQRNAMESWEKGIEFKQLVLHDQEIMSCLNAADVEDLFKGSNFVRHVDYIFARVFGGSDA
jgi:adenylosuccinate lyase